MSAQKDLHDVFVNDLKDLYSAGQQLNRTLPQLAEAATRPEIKSALHEQLEENEVHVLRLDYIAATLHLELAGANCPVLEDLVSADTCKPWPDPGVADASIIGLAQKIETYETTSYTNVCSYARLLGYANIAEIIELTLDEQTTATKRLVQLAELLHFQAVA